MATTSASCRPISAPISGKYFTGDGCRRDEDGYYWITGRVDDVLNVSGHRLGTAEIESALVSHPLVAEAAVVGYPHDIKGQGIYCYVTLIAGEEGSPALEAELRAHVRAEISPIATPDLIHFTPALAQDPLGQDHAPDPAEDRRERLWRARRHLDAGRAEPGRRPDRGAAEPLMRVSRSALVPPRRAASIGVTARLSAIFMLLRATGGLILTLGAPEHRGRRFALLRASVARLFNEGRRIALSDRDTIVVSHPKSGRTWLRYMLDHLGIHLTYTHQRPALPLLAGLESGKIIFLHRDPRDTAVSHWFALTKRRPGGYAGPLFELLRDPELGLASVIRFNLFWAERIGRGGGLVLSYEELHADTPGALRRAAAFVRGQPGPEAALREAVAAGRFENMRAIELSGRGARLYGDVLEPGDPADPDSYKTRQGEVGGWRRHFTRSDAAFADELLESCDYFRRMGLPAAPAREWFEDRLGANPAEGSLPCQPGTGAHFTPALPTTRSGKIMRRILRKIADNDCGARGNTSTLADPSLVDELVDGRSNR